MTNKMRAFDDESRRQSVAEVAVQVIAEEGLDAATIRHIAAKAGFSTTIITHYFIDKDELLMLAFQHISNLARERLAAVTDKRPDDLLGALMTMTALDEKSYQGWRVYIAFWQKAGQDPAFAAVQQESINRTLTQIETMLRARFGDRSDIPRMARHLIALVQGIAIQQLFDPPTWTPDSIEQTLSREIQFLLCR